MGFGFIPLKQAIEELRTLRCWTDILAEFYMNFIILFITIGVAVHVNNNHPQYGMLALALAGGWYVMIGIESWAAVNGAHINPMITVLFVCTERISFIKALFYIPCQLAGGSAGVWFLKQCMPDEEKHLILPLTLHPGITPLQGVGIEWVITAGLMTCVLGVLDDRMREINMPSFPVGTAIAMGVLVAAPYTGGCMNPNVAFSPAVVTNSWKHHWVYWVGPLLGVFTALTAYYLLSWQRQAIKKKEKEEFSLSMLPKLTLESCQSSYAAASGTPNGNMKNFPGINGNLFNKKNSEDSAGGVSPEGGREDKKEYKGFFIKQTPPVNNNNNNESSTDGEGVEVQKGFYKKPANIHHRF